MGRSAFVLTIAMLVTSGAVFAQQPASSPESDRGLNLPVSLDRIRTALDPDGTRPARSG
jgi:hypothetical protein